MPGDDHLETLTRLRGLLEVTRVVRSQADIGAVLEAVARAIEQSLGFAVVVINVYRPAWDDFVVAAVEGDASARETLLGVTYEWDVWRGALDERFDRRGAYLIPEGSYDWSGQGPRYVPVRPATEDPELWHAGDELFVPFRHSDGHLLGVVSVGEPVSGRRPTDDQLDVLVAVGAHAALAMQSAQEAAELARNRRALDELLAVSAKLGAKESVEEVLQAVAGGVRGALGFTRVAVELADPATGRLVPRASSGWSLDDPVFADRPTLDEMRPLMDARFEVGGCYLVAPEDASSLLPRWRSLYRSTLVGRGPHAWRGHALMAPLHGPDGDMIGRIWVDDPDDRLLPATELLHSLRLFADQASVAIDAAARVAELRYLADHDALTGLLNRRAFVRELADEVDRAERYGRSLALMLCDLDGFKRLNDAAGHQAGDDALREVGKVLSSRTRASDRVFRVGGDEFAVILPEADGVGAPMAMRRISLGVQTRLASIFPGLGASFGVGLYPGDATDPDELYRRTDAALYDAKRSGRRVVFSGTGD